MKNLEFNLLEVALINYAITTERDNLKNFLDESKNLRPESNFDFVEKTIKRHNDILDKIKTFAENYGK